MSDLDPQHREVGGPGDAVAAEENPNTTALRLVCDVVVVGGGHAGVEAAAAAARLGCRTVLVTPDLSRLGQMSCNPAIGGIAKGVVAREVDALGGVMGRATDASRIHFRMLNRRKGPAVWGPRAQCDRGLYTRAVRRVIEELPGLDLYQDLVTAVELDGGTVEGVRTRSGVRISAGSVVVTTGTFLRGRIHVGGEAGVPGGRAGEAASLELAEALEAAGLELGRFKTGTPPRVDGRTVDLDALERQEGETEDFRFSSYIRERVPEQRPCWITWTGPALRDVVAENLRRSALYGGEIAGRGPRYCPSIEDKIVRFPQAERHQVFLEPEGLETAELYVNGLSTSLPPDVQLAFLRTVPGLEEVRMTRPGYAIEYDYFPPHQLTHSLRVRGFDGLFFAGQINGTTGYEEAAGQGVLAGANAALAVQERAPWVLDRDEAYIGVMVDDLVTRGVDEPYRLFTSRAEFRLLLRQDNAIDRLGPMGAEMGLLTPRQLTALAEARQARAAVRSWFTETTLRPDDLGPTLALHGSSPVAQPLRAAQLVKRPEIPAEALVGVGPSPLDPSLLSTAEGRDALAAVEVDLKYAGYVDLERQRAARLRERRGFVLEEDLPYDRFVTLSAEARERLLRVRPGHLGQAERIPGLTPADLQNLVLEVRRHRATASGGAGST